jgi:regulator of sigma E protease
MGKLEPKLAPLTDAMAKGYSGVVWRIGVVQQQDYRKVGIVDATRAALTYPVIQTKAISQSLYGIVFGSEKADPGGPIRMVEEFQGAFSRSIWDGYRLLLALSVYLGLFNLLPVPALDGGRLVFLAYELVTRRRANPKIEAMVHMAGIMALGVLMIFVMIVDVRRFF